MSCLVQTFQTHSYRWLPQLMTGLVAYRELVSGVLKAHHADKAHAHSSIAGSCCLLDSLDRRGHILHPEGTIQRHHHEVLPVLPSQVGTCRNRPVAQAQHAHCQLELEVRLKLACGVPKLLWGASRSP